MQSVVQSPQAVKAIRVYPPLDRQCRVCASMLCRMCSSRPTARHAGRPTRGRPAVPADRPHHSSGRAWGNASRETGGGPSLLLPALDELPDFLELQGRLVELAELVVDPHESTVVADAHVVDFDEPEKRLEGTSVLVPG